MGSRLAAPEGSLVRITAAKSTSVAPSLFFPPSRPVFPFPVHWPELGVDLGLDYCHPLLIYHWPELGVDLGLDHWHQPLPGVEAQIERLISANEWGVTTEF